MKNRTDNLTIGSLAPAFTLTAANREEKFSLRELTSHGALVIEFTRGTW
jgi:peroxiredoxin